MAAKNKQNSGSQKELRHLTRTELLELLVDMSEELEKTRAERDELARKLEDREIKIEKAGTLAEASFALAGVLEAAQNAADLYLENLKRQQPAEEPADPEPTTEQKEEAARDDNGI